MDLIEYSLRVAKKYYKPKTYMHAIRVANYVSENKLIPKNILNTCIALAIMHDIIEDTDWNETLGRNLAHFEICLHKISKPDNVSYNDYIKQIHDEADYYPEVYWVKLADMKDHLSLKDTLTDKLKEKYLNALPILL